MPGGRGESVGRRLKCPTCGLRFRTQKLGAVECPRCGSLFDPESLSQSPDTGQ